MHNSQISNTTIVKVKCGFFIAKNKRVRIQIQRLLKLNIEKNDYLEEGGKNSNTTIVKVK